MTNNPQFREQLSEKEILKLDNNEIEKIERVNENSFTIIDENSKIDFVKGFFKDDIQQHCLDKQKVRDAIEKATLCNAGHTTVMKEELERELGL